MKKLTITKQVTIEYEILTYYFGAWPRGIVTPICKVSMSLIKRHLEITITLIPLDNDGKQIFDT